MQSRRALLARITSEFEIDLRRIYLIYMFIGCVFARLLANAKLDGGSCSRLFRGETHRSLRCCAYVHNSVDCRWRGLCGALYEDCSKSLPILGA